MKRNLIVGIFLTIILNLQGQTFEQLNQWCVDGNYLQADSMLSPASLTIQNDPATGIDNNYLSLCGEVYLNTSNLKELSTVLDNFSGAVKNDTVQWPALRLLKAYQSFLQSNTSAAENICTEIGADKELETSFPEINYLALAFLTDLQFAEENYYYSVRLVNLLTKRAEKIFKKNDRHFVENHERQVKISLYQGHIEQAEQQLQALELHFRDKNVQYTLDHAAFLLLQCELYLLKGEPAVCASNLKKASAILEGKLYLEHPLYIQSHILQVKLSNFIGNYGKSFKQLCEINLSQLLPEDSYRYSYELANLYALSGLYKKAATITEKYPLPASFSKGGIAYLRHQLLSLLINQNITNYDYSGQYQQLLDSISKVTGPHHYLYIEGNIQYARYLYKSGRYDQTINMYRKTIEGIKVYYSSIHPYYIAVQEDLAMVYWAKGDKKKALQLFTETSDNYNYQYNKYFAILSEKEKNIFYSRIRLFYEKFNAFMLNEHKQMPRLIGMAYDFRLANKAILFNSTQELKNAIYNGSDSVLIQKFKEWNRIRENLAKAYKLMAEGVKVDPNLVDDLQTKAESMEEYIQLRASINESKGGRVKKNVYWHDVASYLNNNEAAVETIRIAQFNPDSGGYFTNKISYAFLFVTRHTKNQPNIAIIHDGNELEKRQINFYKNSIRFKTPDSLSYIKFIDPLLSQKKMHNIHVIYISLDGIYNKLNLNTLYSYVDNEYLLNKFKFKLLTNLKDVITLKQEKRKQQQIPPTSVLLGYPNYYSTSITDLINNKNNIGTDTSRHRSARGSEISDLPGTKVEIETIRALLTDSVKNHTVSAFLAKEANEENLKTIKSPGILHVATHGFFNEPNNSVLNEDTSSIKDLYKENPLLLCGILLSGAGFAYENEVLSHELKVLSEGQSSEDGILTAYEAMNMDLRGLELAILSACETGLGKIQSGEGVYGFQRALQTAGAKSILMSLWKVDDMATKKLMIYFYDAWNKTGDKSKAFDIAQNKIKDEFKDPKYWGAFIMIGW